MAEATEDGTDGPADRALRDLLDGERHRLEVEERRRRHGARLQADESVTFAEVLRALGAHGSVVSLQTTAGPLGPAVVCEVGRDYLAVRPEGAPVRLVPLHHITAASPVAPAAPGGDPVPLDLTERLRELAATGTRVGMGAEPSTTAGRLRRVGRDVVVLELDDGTEVFIGLDSVTQVVVDP